MQLLTAELVTLLIVGWVLALGAIFIRYRRGEFGTRSGLSWVMIACFAIGWALWQYERFPATAETLIGTLAPWAAALLSMAGTGVAFYLYRTRPTGEAQDPEQS
ncbi:hypothetical protein [Haloferax sp. DFSO60]|uniref:hypothetical protein n=1 Tax=Haloferax sp. DFSO60 TaxID=3388652 RepID=UPI00397904F0